MKLYGSLLVTLVLMTVTGSAIAADPMAAYYGNTLHETRANGTQSWFLFNADHTFTSRSSSGATSKGSWHLDKQRETCISMPNSPANARPACVKLHAERVGDSWERQGPHGTEHYVLEAGRQPAQ